jgi:hypothetical protein
VLSTSVAGRRRRGIITMKGMGCKCEKLRLNLEGAVTRLLNLVNRYCLGILSTGSEARQRLDWNISAAMTHSRLNTTSHVRQACSWRPRRPDAGHYILKRKVMSTEGLRASYQRLLWHTAGMMICSCSQGEPIFASVSQRGEQT